MGLWRVGRIGTTATQSAAVEAGALVLRSANSSQNNLLNVSHRFAVAGDFSATFDFEGFVSGGDGAFVQAVISENVAQPTSLATAGIGKVPQTSALVPGISAAFQPGSSDLKAATGVAGTFRFQRTGSSVTVTTRLADGTMATVTDPTYGTFNLQFGVQIGSNLAGVIVAESSIRIGAFTVTGGGGSATSDDFACDSLTP